MIRYDLIWRDVMWEYICDTIWYVKCWAVSLVSPESECRVGEHTCNPILFTFIFAVWYQIPYIWYHVVDDFVICIGWGSTLSTTHTAARVQQQYLYRRLSNFIPRAPGFFVLFIMWRICVRYVFLFFIALCNLLVYPLGSVFYFSDFSSLFPLVFSF